MPGSWEQALGEHTLLVVGYSDPIHRFIERNSWGRSLDKDRYFQCLLIPARPEPWRRLLGNNDGRIIMYFVCIQKVSPLDPQGDGTEVHDDT
jgi:hypothetical protein